MSDKVLKLKCNENLTKWCLTIFFLLGNFIFFGLLDKDIDNTARFIFIVVPVISDLLALACFIIFSIFPRIYYCIDDEVMSIQSKSGEIKGYIPWAKVKRIECCYSFGMHDGYSFVFCEGYASDIVRLAITEKQARILCNEIPTLKNLFVV